MYPFCNFNKNFKYEKVGEGRENLFKMFNCEVNFTLSDTDNTGSAAS